MALRPIWWWFWLGWFPLFWFYPSYINAPIKTRKANGDYSYSYYSGVGSIVSWVFFVVFLILFLSVTTYSTWWYLWYYIWIFFLFFIIVFWCAGIANVFTFEGEHEQEQEALDNDANDTSPEEGGEKVEELQPMRMRSSKQMKSLNMQL